MRIYGPNGTNVVANAPHARRAPAQAFTIDHQDSARPTASTPLRSVGSIDALIALQGVEHPTERRRRAVRRGRSALDALDELKLGLLAGSLDTAALTRLKSAVGDLSAESGDGVLDGVLAEIRLRVEVEIAKFGPPQRNDSPAK